MRNVKRRREKAGRQHRDHAVGIRHARAHGDEREHVEVAGHERSPAAHEERPAGPQHDRRRESELHDIRHASGKQRPKQMPAHFQRHHGQRKREPDPEAARHIGKLGIGFRAGACKLGFERHAANRARAGALLANLRMHRAGVDRAFRRRLLRALIGRKILFRIGRKLAAAAGGAEIIAVVVKTVTMRRRVRIDVHAAHGIDGAAARLMMRHLFHRSIRLKRIPGRGI